MIFLLIGVLLIIISLEIPRLLRKSWYKEIGLFLFFYMIGAYMSLAQLYDWALYNPLQFLITLMAPLL